MATNGLSTYLYAPMDEKTEKYGDVKKLAGAISYKESLTKNSSKVYADNALKISDSSVTGGKVDLGVDDDDPAIFSPLLGHAKKKIKVGDEMLDVNVGNSNDVPIYVGFGFIENEKNEKSAYYTVNFYPKVTFEPYNKEGSTRQENNDYKTPTVTGTIYGLSNADYKYDRRCKNMLEALKVLYALFGKEAPSELEEQYGKETDSTETDSTETDPEEITE